MDPGKQNTGKTGFDHQPVLEANPGLKPLQLMALEQLVKKLAPVICFHPEEGYTPVTVEWYLQKVLLVNGVTGVKLAATIPGLQEAAVSSNKYYLEPKGEELMQVDKKPVKTYVHAKAYNDAYIDLQYWFLFAQAGGASAHAKWLIDETIKGYEGLIDLNPLGRFNGHWQRITVRINNISHNAEQVFFPQQGEGAWVAIDKVQRRGNGILVYASKDNHAFYPEPGFNDAKKTRFNLYSSQLDFCLRHETANGREVNFSEAWELVAASSFENKMEARAWLHFQYHWGNPNPGYLTMSCPDIG